MSLSKRCRDAIDAAYRNDENRRTGKIPAISLAVALCTVGTRPIGVKHDDDQKLPVPDPEATRAIYLSEQLAPMATVRASDLMLALALSSKDVRDWLLANPAQCATLHEDLGKGSSPRMLYAVVALSKDGQMTLQTQNDRSEAARLQRALLDPQGAAVPPRTFARGRLGAEVQRVEIFQLDVRQNESL